MTLTLQRNSDIPYVMSNKRAKKTRRSEIISAALRIIEAIGRKLFSSGNCDDDPDGIAPEGRYIYECLRDAVPREVRIRNDYDKTMRLSRKADDESKYRAVDGLRCLGIQGLMDALIEGALLNYRLGEILAAKESQEHVSDLAREVRAILPKLSRCWQNHFPTLDRRITELQKKLTGHDEER